MSSSSSDLVVSGFDFRELTDVIIKTGYERRLMRNTRSFDTWDSVLPREYGSHIAPLTCAGNIISTEACRCGLNFDAENDLYSIITADSPQYRRNPDKCFLDHDHDEHACDRSCIKTGRLGDISPIDPISTIFNDGALWSDQEYISDGEDRELPDAAYDARNRDCAVRIQISQEVRDMCYRTGFNKFYDSGIHFALHDCFSPLDLVESLANADYCGCMHVIMSIHFINGLGHKLMLVDVDAESG